MSKSSIKTQSEALTFYYDQFRIDYTGMWVQPPVHFDLEVIGYHCQLDRIL